MSPAKQAKMSRQHQHACFCLCIIKGVAGDVFFMCSVCMGRFWRARCV